MPVILRSEQITSALGPQDETLTPEILASSCTAAEAVTENELRRSQIRKYVAHLRAEQPFRPVVVFRGDSQNMAAVVARMVL